MNIGTTPAERNLAIYVKNYKCIYPLTQQSCTKQNMLKVCQCSLVTNETEHFFYWPLRLPFVKCLVKTFVHFVLISFCFLIDCRTSLCILEINPSPVKYVADICSDSWLASLFFLKMFLCQLHSNLSVFFLMVSASRVYLKNCFLPQVRVIISYIILHIHL